MMGTNLAQRVQNNAAAQRGGRGTTITSMIARMTPEIQKALPKHMDADRVARIALTAVRKTPALAECDEMSFMGALLTAASLGLEPNTPAGECYLQPFRDRRAGIVECQLVVGYQGMTKLFYQHPLAKHISAHAVREGDEFDYAYGLSQYLRHKPMLGNQGPVIAYYAVGELKSGASDFVVLSPDEVLALRQGKDGPSGKIADPMKWMERKTALRQLLKTMPKSTELMTAMSADEQNGRILNEARRDGADLAAIEPAPEPPAETAPSGVDTETGEVTEGEPPADLWGAEEAEAGQ